VIIGIQKQRRARKGLTSHRYRTAIGIISRGRSTSKLKGKQFEKNGLFSGSKKWEHLYL
jgi:hypothetical protein